MITFLGIKDYRMYSENPIFNSADSIDRDNLFLPEVILNDYSEKVELVLKPIFDSLWQSFGFSKCRHYDSEGKWILND